MIDKRVLVYGASGHGKVVIDTIEKRGDYEIIGIIDDDSQKVKNIFCGYPVLGGFNLLGEKIYSDYKLILAVGNNGIRQEIDRKLMTLNNRYEFISAIHPSAQIGRNVRIGHGTVAMANTVINSGTKIGKHVIINTGATIDHDCSIGDYVHISPGVHIAGIVSVGELSHIGIGACVIQGVRIGSNSVIGAGAAVVDDIPDNVIAAGVPAKIKKEKRVG